MLRAVRQSELGGQPDQATLDLIRQIRTARGMSGAARSGTEPPPASAAPAAPTARPSIAVLPFAGHPEGSDAALLGEGLAGELIVNLSRDRGLLVVSRRSSFSPQVAQAAPDVIGPQLGVRFLLSGSVRRAGERIRVMAHLTRCDDASDLWSDSSDREIGDIFALQSGIARMVMATATGRIVEEEALRGGRARPQRS